MGAPLFGGRRIAGPPASGSSCRDAERRRPQCGAGSRAAWAGSRAGGVAADRQRAGRSRCRRRRHGSTCAMGESGRARSARERSWPIRCPPRGSGWPRRGCESHDPATGAVPVQVLPPPGHGSATGTAWRAGEGAHRADRQAGKSAPAFQVRHWRCSLPGTLRGRWAADGDPRCDGRGCDGAGGTGVPASWRRPAVPGRPDRRRRGRADGVAPPGELPAVNRGHRARGT